MYMPRTCLSIGLLLISMVLITAFLGIRAFSRPVPRLVVVKAWLVAFWPYGASLACVTLGQGNGECLAKCLLRSAKLGFLLGRPKLRL